jgi:lysophospholipase L1-like esterase
MFPNTAVDSNKIITYNNMLKSICNKMDVTFINAYPHFLVNGKLNEKLISDDGLHLSGEGYYLLSSILKPYIQ